MIEEVSELARPDTIYRLVGRELTGRIVGPIRRFPRSAIETDLGGPLEMKVRDRDLVPGHDDLLTRLTKVGP